jgi:hypothetical protein
MNSLVHTLPNLMGNKTNRPKFGFNIGSSFSLFFLNILLTRQGMAKGNFRYILFYLQPFCLKRKKKKIPQVVKLEKYYHIYINFKPQGFTSDYYY